VRVLNTGQFFGEIAFLTGNRRTATIQTKNYSQIGKVSKEHFQELCQNYPEIKKKLFENLRQYQDQFKKWQKQQLKNINYFQHLSNEILETLVYKLRQEYFEDGQLLFKHNEQVQQVYILADGQVDTFVSLNDEDLVLDTLQVPGSVLCQYSILQKAPITYSARATMETHMLVLSIDTINKLKERDELKDLKRALWNMQE